jgi:hypothetical protein
VRLPNPNGACVKSGPVAHHDRSRRLIPGLFLDGLPLTSSRAGLVLAVIRMSPAGELWVNVWVKSALIS